MNPKLKQAVSIFKELGWESATPENILDLPIGTPEQRKQALEGLKSGQLGDFVVENRVHRWKTHYNVNQVVLVLFAIRIGVTPARARTMLTSTWDKSFGDSKVKVLASRGEKFATSVVAAWYGSGAQQSFSEIPVRLVYEAGLEIPEIAGYIQDWAWLAVEAMGINHHRWIDPDLKWLSPDIAVARFAEHIQVGLAAKVPLTHNFGQVMLHGIQIGLVERDDMIPHIFAALDAAIRPADRRALIEMLDELKITDDEISGRVQSLIPILATSDTAVINRFAPPLIAHVPDDLLVEVMLSAFSSTVKKTRLLVLKAAQGRKCPPSSEDIAPWLSILAADKDKGVATAANKLMKTWAIEEAPAYEGETAILGLWQDTPPVWEVPAFEIGEISQAALTDCIAKVYERHGPDVHDVEMERLLAVAVALAYENKADAKAAMSGLKTNEWWGALLLHFLNSWSKGEKLVNLSWVNKMPLSVRDMYVAANLGKLPCLLSMPSKVDLSITVADLADRLALYSKLGVAAVDSDLFIALTRLDVDTKTPEAVKILKTIKVSVSKPNGGLMRRVMSAVNAGDLVLKYLDDPAVEMAATPGQASANGNCDISKAPYGCSGKMPKSLAIFNQQIPEAQIYAVFPFWGDAAFKGVGWNNGYHTHAKGHELRQIARRWAPLPPGGTINMLGALRSSSQHEQEDTSLAITEAWERGLLHPGIADIALLDWREKGPPANLGALAVALEGLARSGMLSLVWPIWDELIETSMKETRLLSGTAELAALIEEFLPEVQHAVSEGRAGESALALPGICKLAQHGGSSKAVTAAKKVVAQLPVGANSQHQDNTSQDATNTAHHGPLSSNSKSATVIKPILEMTIPFDNIWQKPAPDTVVIEDNVDMTITTREKTRDFLFTLTLPNIPDKVFNITNIWPYNIENSGVCAAHMASANTSKTDYRASVFLHWDSREGALVVRDKMDGKSKVKHRLSLSILTMILTITAQGNINYTYDYNLNMVKNLAKKEGFAKKDGQINQKVAKRAMEIILQNPAVSPAKLVRSIEKDITLLPVLWPILTESIKLAGAVVATGEKLPQWTNRVLDVCLQYAPYMKEAANRGYISDDDAKWPGLREIAEARFKSVAVDKAAALVNVL